MFQHSRVCPQVSSFAVLISNVSHHNNRQAENRLHLDMKGFAHVIVGFSDFLGKCGKMVSRV